MGLIQSIEDRILSAAAKFLEPVLSPLRKLWEAIKSFFTALIDLVPESIQLFKSVKDEVIAWRTFKEGVNFKSGVINLQSAKDAISDILGEIVAAYHSFLDIWKGAKINPLEQINEAAASLADVIEEFGKIGRFTEFIKGVGPKLEKMGGKVFEVLAIIQQIAETLLHVVRDLQTIVNAVRDVRKLFQTGEGLFLKQTNKRRVETLEDGTKIKIRLGNLHQ